MVLLNARGQAGAKVVQRSINAKETFYSRKNASGFIPSAVRGIYPGGEALATLCDDMAQRFFRYHRGRLTRQGSKDVDCRQSLNNCPAIPSSRSGFRPSFHEQRSRWVSEIKCCSLKRIPDSLTHQGIRVVMLCIIVEP